MTTDVKLQKAVAYCVQTGATVAESAEKFSVDKAKLSEMMSELMNPQGGGAPTDVAQFTQNSKVAHATIRVMGKPYEIVAVAVGSEKGATARIYDENGMEIDANEFKELYNIRSFKADHNTGEITVVAYDNAPGIKVEQEGKKGNFFDTLANLWKRGRETANSGVEIVAKRNDVAKAGGTEKATNVAGEQGTAVGAEKDFAQLAADYGVPAQDVKVANKTAKEMVAKMSDEDKADLAEKLEAGDYDGFQKAIANLASGFLPEDMPGITTSKEVFYATLAVGVAVAIAGAAEAGAGAVLSAVAERVGQSGIGKAAVALFAAAGLTSCSPDDGIGGKTDINQTVNITITQNSSLEDALDALLQGQKVQTEILQKILEKEIENGMTAKEILDMCGGNQQLLSNILDALTKNNNLLAEVKNSINSGVENITNALVDIKGSVDNITNLIKDFPQYSTQLNEIINGIKTGNATMSDMKALIEDLLKQANKNGDVQVNILNKLTEIENSNKSDGEKLADMLKLLGEIKAGIDGIADGLKDHFKNDATINSYLEKILAEAKKNNAKTDETNALLKELYALVEKLGNDGDKLGKEILNYIAAVGFEMNRNFTAVLEAINKGVAGADSLRDLLEKVLEKQDKNTKDIIDAIGNIKISGGSVDLSSIEKMLAELLKQSKANGDILSNIDAKTDVISTTTKSILAALEKEFGKNDERYKNINNILTVIANKAGGKGDDEKLLAKLDEILKKLDKIKDAIKNHKVEIHLDPIEVECKCNCGKDHEGILGDLNNILS